MGDVGWTRLRRSGSALLLVLGAAAILGKLAGLGCASRNAPPPAVVTERAQTDLLEGSWTGEWSSTSSGMDGALRCVIQKTSEGVYQAKFDAVFAKVFTHQSSVKLNARPNGDQWDFSGEEDLGFLSGGVYKYAGHSDGNEFTCTYDSSFDKGTFRMSRATAPRTLPSTHAVP